MVFFQKKKIQIKKDLKILSKLECSIIFFVSAKKINKTISLIKEYFLDRDIVICKEITKYYEEYFRSSIDKLDKFEENLKGEITIVISEKRNNQKIINELSESDEKKFKKLIKKLSIKDIASLISEEKNISKKLIYNYCLKLKNEK